MSGLKRVVSTSFWKDDLVLEQFTPEDKYFMLYLLTNEYTTQLGIYHLPLKQAAFDMGYTKESVVCLIRRFQDVHDIIRFSESTNEVAIKNYLRHSIIKGGKPVYDCLVKEASLVKDKSLLKYVVENIKSHSNDESIGSTVMEFIEYICKYYSINIDSMNTYINDNENDNDNERIVHDSLPNGDKKQPSMDLYTIQLVTTTWNELSVYGVASISKIVVGTERYKNLKSRINDYGVEDVLTAIGNVKKSKFLCGKNDKGWKISFNWFVLPNNFPKVLEGNYTDSECQNVMSEEKPKRYDGWGNLIER